MIISSEFQNQWIKYKRILERFVGSTMPGTYFKQDPIECLTSGHVSRIDRLICHDQEMIPFDVEMIALNIQGIEILFNIRSWELSDQKDSVPKNGIVKLVNGTMQIISGDQVYTDLNIWYPPMIRTISPIIEGFFSDLELFDGTKESYGVYITSEEISNFFELTRKTLNNVKMNFADFYYPGAQKISLIRDQNSTVQMIAATFEEGSITLSLRSDDSKYSIEVEDSSHWIYNDHKVFRLESEPQNAEAPRVIRSKSLLLYRLSKIISDSEFHNRVTLLDGK